MNADLRADIIARGKETERAGGYTLILERTPACGRQADKS